MVKSQGLGRNSIESQKTRASSSELPSGPQEPPQKAETGSRSALRRLLLVYQTACRSGEVGEADLQAVVGAFRGKLGKAGVGSKHWGRYSSLFENFGRASVAFLKRTPAQAGPMYREITPVLPLFQPFPALLLLLFKRTVRNYLQSPPQLDATGLDFLTAILHTQGADRTSLLSAAVLAYTGVCSEYRSDLDILQKRVMKLMKTDFAVCEGVIVKKLHTLEDNLMQFSDSSNKEAIETVVNWQFLQTIGLCGMALSYIRKPTERYMDQWLQIVFSALKVSDELRYSPWKLHLTKVLIQVETAAKAYFPGVSSALLSLLASPDLHKRIKPTESSVDLSSVLEAKQQQMMCQSFREALIREICESLLRHLAVCAQSPSFPELSLPIREVLARESQVSRKLLSQTQSVLEKTLKTLTEASKWAETRRQTQGTSPLSGVSPLVQALS